MPANPSSNFAELERLAESYIHRLRKGEQPSLDEYADDHPHQAEAIRELFPTLALLEDIAPPEGGPAGQPGSADEPTRGGSAEGTPIKTLGDFRILREIGRGGMGVVYEAEQISLHRRVALKVLPFAAVMDPRQLERFKNEAQAAASLHHSNIVPVFGVGCERGVHYYAMQYIEGQTLQQAISDLREMEGLQPSTSASQLESTCVATLVQGVPQEEPGERRSEGEPHSAETVKNVQQGISTARSTRHIDYIRRIAELGVQTAEALDQAHQQGILHRDIKPSNLILDANGKVWITDFGLARIEGGTSITMTGDLVGTLRYMSPEQALAKRVVVDHRSDIYSLGVTLYELLTLRPAFETDNRAELIKQIALHEPPRPRRHNRSIPAELETILSKALRKSPEDRYESAQDLADDLKRFLQHRPIRARKPTLAERGQMLFRRNRRLAAALVVGVVLAIAGLAASSFLIWKQQQATESALGKVTTERNAAQEAQKQADQARREAEEVVEYMIEAFRGPDPERDGRTITVAEMLDRSIEDVRNSFKDQPLVRARLLVALAQTYSSLGLPNEAIPALKLALGTQRPMLGKHHLETLKSEFVLAIAYREVGRLVNAIDLAKQNVKGCETSLGHDHQLTLHSNENLGLTYLAMGRLAESIELFEQTTEVMRATLGKNHQSTLSSMNNLATAYTGAGRLNEAVELHEKVLKARQVTLGVHHVETLLSMSNLAGSYDDVGRLTDSIDLNRQTLEARRNILGDDHPHTRQSVNNLAVAYYNAGRIHEAAKMFEQTLDLRRTALGTDHPSTLATAGNLASAFLAVGRIDEAIELQEQTLEAMNDILGDDHPNSLVGAINLATAYADADRHQDAIRLYEQTLKVARSILGVDHPTVLSCMFSLGVAYDSVGREQDAIKLTEQTLEGRRAKLDGGHPDTLTTMQLLAGLYDQDTERKQEAFELYEQTLEGRRATLGDDHPETLTSMHQLAWMHEDLGHPQKALKLYKEAFEGRLATLGDDHPNTLSSMSNLAGSYAAVGRRHEAIELLEKAFPTSRTALGDAHPDTLTSMSNLATAYASVGRWQKAIELLEPALRIMRDTWGDDHPNTISTMIRLGSVYTVAGQFDDAPEILSAAVNTSRVKFGREHELTLRCLGRLADAQSAAGVYDKAMATYEEAVTAMRDTEYPRLAFALNRYGQLRIRMRQYTDARTLFAEAENMCRTEGSQNSQDLAIALCGLCQVGLQEERFDEARRLANEALQIWQAQPQTNWKQWRAQSLLGESLVGQGNHAEAETLLLEAFEELNARRATIPVTRRDCCYETAHALAELYDAWDKPDDANQWRNTFRQLTTKEQVPASKE